MFRSTLVVFAVVAAAVAQRSFINKCSLSDPELESCFVKNGNLAIAELKKGIEDLQIQSLDGFDLGDLFFNLDDDLSFLWEDAKAYPRGVRLENARLLFGPNKQLRGIDLSYFITDITWQLKYRGIGFIDNRKINEKGFAQINFGELRGNISLEFKRIEVDSIGYLKTKNHQGNITVEKFEFIPRDVQASGQALLPEHFQQLEKPAIVKALEISLNFVTFVFNQIFQEIPEREIFLE